MVMVITGVDSTGVNPGVMGDVSPPPILGGGGMTCTNISPPPQFFEDNYLNFDIYCKEIGHFN